MTVSSTVTKVTYDGNDSTTEFPYTFDITESSDISVFITNEDGEVTELSSNYSVDTESKTVNYPTLAGSDPLATGEQLTVARVLPLTQPVTLRNQSQFNSGVIESEFDRLTYMAQQIQEQLDRCVKYPISSHDEGTDPASVLSAATVAAAKAAEAEESAQRAETASAIAVQYVVSPLDYGCVGDGVANDTANMQTAINAACALGRKLHIPGGYNFIISSSGGLSIPSPLIIEGDGKTSKLTFNNRSGTSFHFNSDFIKILNVGIDGNSPGGIRIGAAGTRRAFIKVGDCHFFNIGQAVWLYACDDVDVIGNTFDSCGYCVIQQANYPSSNIRVLANTIINAGADFVEANCTSSAPSKNWIISDNIYKGASGFPTSATEKRFVGITALENVTITNNIIENTAGDSAIHLEDIKGKTIISGNHLKNCTGPFAYFYLLNSAEDTIITGNIISHTDISLPHATVLDLSSGNYGMNLNFSNNFVYGNSNYTLDGLIISFNSGKITFNGNQFFQCNYIAECDRGRNVSMFSNIITDCNYGIKSRNTEASGDNTDWTIAYNTFEVNIATIDIRRNSNGTNPSKRWIVQGNRCNKNIRIYDGQDCKGYDNFMTGGSTCNVDASNYGSGSGNTNNRNTELA